MSELRRRGNLPDSQSSPQRTSSDEEHDRREVAAAPKSNHHIRQIVVVVTVLLAALAIIGAICYWTLYKERRPNVLLLIADDLGWADVGWHSSDINTPTLTRLASQGVVLSHFYSQPICTASRAALFTGRYPFKLGLQGSRPILAGAVGSLPLNNTLLSELMQDAGYKTHMVGKWHLGFETLQHVPVMRGFHTFTGFYNGMQDYYTHTTSGFDTVEEVGGYDMRRDRILEDGAPLINDTMWDAKGTHNTYIFTSEAVRLINHHNEDSPLFLAMTYANPHTPIQVPDYFVNLNNHIDNDIRRNYAGLVSAMDSSVENITAALAARGFLDNTIIIFISDNGGTLTDMKSVPSGSSNFPLKGDKGGLWEGGSRVPAFVSGKNIPQGKRLDSMVHITDIFPTLMTCLNLEAGLVVQDLDGVDQTAVIKLEKRETERKYFIYDIDPVYKQAAIRYGNWKLLLGIPAINGMNGRYDPLSGNETTIENAKFEEFYSVVRKAIKEYKSSGKMCTTTECFHPGLPATKLLLYDLSRDEYEFNNLAPLYPDLVRQLLDILDKEMKYMVSPVNLLEQGEPAASPNHFNGTWMPWRT